MRHGNLVLRKGSKLQLLVFLLSRSLVVQLTSMGHPSSLSPREKRLGADISILGGNRTGIYVQWVKPGSQVESTGLREGCRLIKVGLGNGIVLEMCSGPGRQGAWSEPQCKLASGSLEALLHLSCFPVLLFA